MKKHLLFIPVLILVVANAFAQKNNFYATASKQKIVIGEPFLVMLQATITQGSGIKWSPDTIPHFEILAKSKVDTQANGRELNLKQTLTVTSWDSGRWQLVLFPASQLRKGTKNLVVDVAFSPFDPAQNYHDIKDILDVKKPERVTWYWYLIGAALLILLFLLLFPKRKKGKEVITSPADAYKDAMAKLAALQGKESTDVKLFYSELVDIFRTYVHYRKSIHSFQKTTDDLAVQLKQVALPTEEYNALVQVLRLSDVVKFARYTPSAAENEMSLLQIKKSIIAIENTK